MRVNKGEDEAEGKNLKELNELLQRFLNGETSSEEGKVINQWYESLAGEKELSPEEELSLKNKVWQRLNEGIESVENKKVETLGSQSLPYRIYRYRWWAAAAVIIGAFGLIFQDSMKPAGLRESQLKETDIPWIEYKNASRISEDLILPDNSLLTLKPGAIVKYHSAFKTGTRHLYLTGEASFDVKRDEAHPFLVFTGAITTQVLGTKFIIHALPNTATVEVDVLSGKVAVFNNESKKESSGVVLTPNQKVTYYKADSHWVTDLVDDPMPIALDVESKKFVFDDVPVQEVLKQLTELYGVEFLAADERVYACPFTGDVSHLGDLFEVLDMLCKTTGTTYEVRGTRILINGNGCIDG